MLEYQKIKLLEKHARNKLKLEPFLLRLVGYNPEETRLKIDKFLLHCTPATITLTSCKLLVFLGKEEIEHFKQFEKTIVTLTLAFDYTYFSSPLSFFIKGKMDSFEELRENIYSLEFNLNSVPEAYKQLFLYLSEITTIYRKIYDTKITKEQQENIKRFPVNEAFIYKEGELLYNARVNYLSARHIELNLLNNKLEMGETYRYTIVFNGSQINLSGKPVKNKENLYISSLDFSLEYIHVLSKFMKLNTDENNTDTEELEEI